MQLMQRLKGVVEDNLSLERLKNLGEPCHVLLHEHQQDLMQLRLRQLKGLDVTIGES